MSKFSKKKPLDIILSLLLILTSLPLTLTVFAETSDDGYLTYEVTDGEYIITRCDESISGDYNFPN